MHADKLALLLATYSHPLVIALLAACGFGAPLSEDMIAVSAGMVVAHSGGSLALMMATVFAGVLIGDTIAFRIGRKLGPAITRHKRFGKVLTPKRMKWVSEHFARRGKLTIFVARFTPGLRMPTLLSAGASGMRFGTFFAIDACAAAIVAPLMTWLGFRFGSAALKEIRSAGHLVVIAVLLLIATAIVVAIVRKRAAMQLARS